MAGERPFLLMAGVGIDAEVVYRLKAGFKDALGALAFWLDGFKMLASYPMTPLTVRASGREIAVTGLIAGKLRRFGPRYFITPAARLDEAQLHVVVFKGKVRVQVDGEPAGYTPVRISVRDRALSIMLPRKE